MPNEGFRMTDFGSNWSMNWRALPSGISSE
jgi:hypothetical protein